MNKKGQMGLEGLYPAVLTIILIGIVLGVGIYVLNETGDAISTKTLTITNEIFTPAATAVAVAQASTCGFHDMVVTNITKTNDTRLTVLLGNYTVPNADLGLILNASTNSTLHPGTWNVSYTYLGPVAGSNSCSSIATSSTGIGTFASWIAVIVVVLAAAIVLGIVISSFGGRQAV